jgi:hypothetical protein
MKRILLFAAVMVIVLPLASRADQYKTIDDLAKAYSAERCKVCHVKTHEEWTSSFHAQSIVHSLGGMRNFFVVGLGQEWKQPVSKAHVMRCMACHAPMLKDATEDLAKKVAQLVVTAVDDKDEKNKTAAKAELAKLNVNCIICHNTMVSIEKNLTGMPKPNVMYSPNGRMTPDHKTERSATMNTPLFCGQCHTLFTPPDGDTFACNTLYGSYQDAYRAQGGSETCQDCHMRAKGRGHRFPGAYETEMVKDGIGLDFQAESIKLHPGKWIPTAVVNIGLVNKAGHRIPDG